MSVMLMRSNIKHGKTKKTSNQRNGTPMTKRRPGHNLNANISFMAKDLCGQRDGG
jgi:hypothetical protein